MDVKKLAEESESYIVERRRYYHAHPELTCEEKTPGTPSIGIWRPWASRISVTPPTATV